MPDRCDKSKATYDECAADMYECLRRTDKYGHLVKVYPEFKREEYYKKPYYSSSKEVHAAICKADAGKFCRGGTTLVIQDVCLNWASVPKEIKENT